MAKAVVEGAVEVRAEQVVSLHPDFVLDDVVTNVRPWSIADDETEAVKELAKSIEINGQINPITVRWKLNDGATTPDEGAFYVVTGRKRLAACRLIGKEFEVKAIVRLGMSDDDAFREAVQENAQRKDASAMDNAANCQTVRLRFGWDGGKNTKRVAEWFGKSPAWVTTHEKLNRLGAEEQTRVQSQGWSAQAAMDLVEVEQPEKLSEVADRAEEIAEQEAEQTGKAKKVKSRHVRQAVREKSAGSKAKRSLKDVVKFFAQFDHHFVTVFNRFVAGTASEKALEEEFFNMTGVSASAPVKVVTAAKGKKKSKPAKKKAKAKAKAKK